MIAAWRGLPVRARLTFWYVGLLIGTLLIIGGLALWTVERTLYAGADDLPRSKAATVVSEVDLEDDQLVLDADYLPGSTVPSIAVGLDVVRVLDPSGRVAFDLESIAGLPPSDPTVLREVLANRTHWETVEAPNRQTIRLYAEPIFWGDQIVGVVQVGRSLAEVERIVRELRLLGTIGLLVALLVGAAGGLFLARRALAPVDRITRAAERIGADDLSRRLALPLPDDELGRLSRAFDGMIERLDQAFDRQRRFTADASHELRTPLAIIRSQVEAARRRPREPDYDRRVLDSVYEENLRLQQLVESLLTLARADAGQPLALRPVDLEELAADVGALAAPRAEELGILLDVQVDEVPRVDADATLLRQLLLNLLDNAFRHTPPGGRVTLAIAPAEDRVRLSVADTGDGIPAEHLPRLFERFYRVDHARSRAAGGTGLGLAICDWIALAHHGRLEVASAVGRGTTFSLWLPADGGTMDESEADAEPVVQPALAHRPAVR